MKLWVKIYTFSLLLLVLTLNIAGFTLIQKLHNDSLKKEVDKAIADEKFVSLQLKNNSLINQDQFLNKSKDDGAIVEELIERCKSIAKRKKGSIELLNTDNEIIYSDMKFPECENKDELNNISVDKTNYVIRTVYDKEYLYVAGVTYTCGMPAKLRYAVDISDVYSEKVNQFKFFAKLDIIICSLFALFMFFISRRITKPIQILTDSTRKIASGEYSERVSINSKDEFSGLASNFNLMAETVERNISELQISNDAKETFINNFTHELKTPLTSIIGYASLIKTSKYDEKLFFESSDYIYKEGRRLENMAFKMMDFIYAKDGAVILKPEDVMEIINDVKKSLLIKLKDKNIDLIIEGSSLTLDVDYELFRILLKNIIENAVKASDDNSKVYVKTEILFKKAIIHVIDCGTGIPKEHLQKIFEPFYVVDKARSRKNNGAGIGLSICKKISESLKAEIKIDSEVGVGTDVKIIFPLHK